MNLASGWVNVITDLPTIATNIKRGHAISAWYKNRNGIACEGSQGYRTESHFIGTNLILIDLDHTDCRSFDDIKKLPYAEYISLIYTTSSHHPALGQYRYRVGFLVEEPITEVKTMRALYTSLIHHYGGDNACKDGARLFYGNENAEIEIAEGRHLPLEIIHSLVAESAAILERDTREHIESPQQTVTLGTKGGRFTLPADTVFITHEHELIVFSEFQQKTAVHCPLPQHGYDAKPGAFIGINGSGTPYFHCAKCCRGIAIFPTKAVVSFLPPADAENREKNDKTCLSLLLPPSESGSAGHSASSRDPQASSFNLYKEGEACGSAPPHHLGAFVETTMNYAAPEESTKNCLALTHYAWEAIQDHLSTVLKVGNINLLHAPAGSGKSHILPQLATVYPLIIVTPRIRLVEQITASCKASGISTWVYHDKDENGIEHAKEARVMIITDKSLKADHLSIQAFQSRHETILLVIDEAHIVLPAFVTESDMSYHTLQRFFKNPKITPLLLTATPNLPVNLVLDDLTTTKGVNKPINYTRLTRSTAKRHFTIIQGSKEAPKIQIALEELLRGAITAKRVFVSSLKSEVNELYDIMTGMAIGVPVKRYTGDHKDPSIDWEGDTVEIILASPAANTGVSINGNTETYLVSYDEVIFTPEDLEQNLARVRYDGTKNADTRNIILVSKSKGEVEDLREPLDAMFLNEVRKQAEAVEIYNNAFKNNDEIAMAEIKQAYALEDRFYLYDPTTGYITYHFLQALLQGYNTAVRRYIRHMGVYGFIQLARQGEIPFTFSDALDHHIEQDIKPELDSLRDAIKTQKKEEFLERLRVIPVITDRVKAKEMLLSAIALHGDFTEKEIKLATRLYHLGIDIAGLDATEKTVKDVLLKTSAWVSFCQLLQFYRSNPRKTWNKLLKNPLLELYYFNKERIADRMIVVEQVSGIIDKSKTLYDCCHSLHQWVRANDNSKIVANAFGLRCEEIGKKLLGLYGVVCKTKRDVSTRKVVYSYYKDDQQLSSTVLVLFNPDNMRLPEGIDLDTQIVIDSLSKKEGRQNTYYQGIRQLPKREFS